MKIKEITEGAFTNALLKTKELTSHLAGHSWKSPHEAPPMKPARQIKPVQTTPNSLATAAPTGPMGATNTKLTPAQQRWAAANKAGAQAGKNLQLAPLPQDNKVELSPGVELISDKPITLSYKGTLFHIDDHDKWHRSSNDKLVSPGMGAFLTKQLQAL